MVSKWRLWEDDPPDGSDINNDTILVICDAYGQHQTTEAYYDTEFCEWLVVGTYKRMARPVAWLPLVPVFEWLEE